MRLNGSPLRAIPLALTLLAILRFGDPRAGIIDPFYSSGVMNNSPAVLTVAPGGADGLSNPEDHVVYVFVLDAGGNPMSIVATDFSLVNDAAAWCPGGVHADSSSYPPDEGMTTFSGVLRGGVGLGADCSGETTDVVVLGHVIDTLDLRFDSPDLNGDGVVTVADFGLFASVFQGDYFCADYDESGGSPSVTVADFAIFASFFNISSCP